jgi:hypothetical protein
MFPEGLTAETIKAYRHTVTANIPAMMEGFEEDIEIIKLYGNAGFITPYRLNQLLENARQKNNDEVAATIQVILNKSGPAIKSLHL